MEYEIHPLMSCIPEMTSEEYADIKESVKAIGFTDPVIRVYQGKILDGRHRYRLAGELGLIGKLRFDEFSGTTEEAKAFLWGTVCRRNLAPGAKAMIYIELIGQEKEEAKERKSKAGGDMKSTEAKNRLASQCTNRSASGGKATARLAKKLGVGTRTVEHAKYVKENGTPEDVKEVAEGKKSAKAKEKEIKERKGIKVQTKPSANGHTMPKPAKVSLWKDHKGSVFNDVTNKLKSLGKVPKKKFMETVGTELDWAWFFSCVELIPYLKIEDDGESMELVVRDEEKSLCQLIRDQLERARKIMDKGNKFKFNYPLIDNTIQDLFDLVCLGSKR